MGTDDGHENLERLLHHVAEEAIAGDGVVVVEQPLSGFDARVRCTSRHAPERTAAINLNAEWLDAVFFIQPRNVGILMLDAYDEDEAYTTERLRKLTTVVRAYLRDGGSIGTRRTWFGRRRPVLRIQVEDHEWVAR